MASDRDGSFVYGTFSFDRNGSTVTFYLETAWRRDHASFLSQLGRLPATNDRVMLSGVSPSVEEPDGTIRIDSALQFSFGDGTSTKVVSGRGTFACLFLRDFYAAYRSSIVWYYKPNSYPTHLYSSSLLREFGRQYYRCVQRCSKDLHDKRRERKGRLDGKSRCPTFFCLFVFFPSFKKRRVEEAKRVR